MGETLSRRAQQFACDNIARFARGGYMRTELGDVLEEFARQEAGRDATRAENAEVGELRAEAEEIATQMAASECIYGDEDGPDWCGNCHGCREQKASSIIARLLATLQPPPSTTAGREEVAREALARALEEAGEKADADLVREGNEPIVRVDGDVALSAILALAPAPGEGS